jgi:hypothetical protein
VEAAEERIIVMLPAAAINCTSLTGKITENKISQKHCHMAIEKAVENWGEN